MKGNDITVSLAHYIIAYDIHSMSVIMDIFQSVRSMHDITLFWVW